MAFSWGVTSTGFGSFTALTPQGLPITNKVTRKNVLGATGNEVASNLIDEMEEITQTFKVNTTAAVAFNDSDAPRFIGKEYNGYCLTGLNIDTTSEDYATVVMTGHKHISPNTHGTVRTVAHGISLASGFGADLFGCTATETNGVQSSSCNISCQHKDEIGASGYTICGENYDGRIEISVTCVGNVTIAAGYDQTNKPGDEANTSHKKYTVTGEKALALA